VLHSGSPKPRGTVRFRGVVHGGDIMEILFELFALFVELTGPWTLDLLWQVCEGLWGPPII